jgi:hypothetical protein
MEISRAANSYQQIANQSNVINADKSMIESRNQSLSQIKDKVDITLPKNLSDQSVKVLNCQDGSKALMTFAEKDKTVSCYVQDANGKMTAIKTENLPQSMKNIDTSEKFNGFLNNAYAKTSVLSDGDIKVDVFQQLKGGMHYSNNSLRGKQAEFKLGDSGVSLLSNGITSSGYKGTFQEFHAPYQFVTKVDNSSIGISGGLKYEHKISEKVSLYASACNGIQHVNNNISQSMYGPQNNYSDPLGTQSRTSSINKPTGFTSEFGFKWNLNK